MSSAPAVEPIRRLRFSIGRNPRPPAGQPHDHQPVEMAFEELAERLASPSIGPKGAAGFYLVARFAPGKRGKRDAIEPASLVMVDLDFGEWSADSIRAAIREPVGWIAHTTASHTIAEPKWRVVFPLDVALELPDWTRLARSFSRWFGYSEGCKDFDRCGEKIAQPVYWPTKETEASPFSCDGDIESPPIGKALADRLVADEKHLEALAAAQTMRERAARDKARKARAEKYGNEDDQTDVIARWNASHGIEETLERYGYTSARAPGGRWLSPNSSKGIPAVRVWPAEGRFFSHHGSDQGTEYEHGDAFDLFRLYEHGGDFTKAVRAAAAELELAHRLGARAAEPPSPSSESGNRHFRLIPFADIDAQLEDDYLVKGILGRGAFAGLIGAPGGSKTFVSLELSLAVGSGTPWRGLRTRRGRVVYIAAEGASGLRNRVTAARRRLALGDPRSVEFYLIPDVVRLVDGSDDVERLVETIRVAIPAGVVDLFVLDTLSRAIAGRDENSAADMTEAIARADRLRSEFGAAVLLVHHSGKDETRGARGHSSLRAALDTELEVRKLGDSFALTLTKAREHESGRVFHHRLEPVEIGVDPDGDPITSCIVRPIGEGESPQSVDLNVNEQRTHEAIRALLNGSAGTSFEAPEAVLTKDLHQWVEQNCKVPRDLRRGVVRKGLDGLKKKGLVATEGKRVFLLAGES